MQGLKANIILFNPVREVPTVAKYLLPMWPWFTLVLGTYWIKIQKVSKEDKQAYLCKIPGGL